MRQFVLIMVVSGALIVTLLLGVVPDASTAGSAQIVRPAVVARATRGVMMVVRPPDLQVPQHINATVGQTLTFPVVAYSQSGEPVHLSAAQLRNGQLLKGPSGLNTYTFTPDERQVGAAFVIFTVKTPKGLATSLATKIIISHPAAPAPPSDLITSTVTEMPKSAPGSEVISVPVVSMAIPSPAASAPVNAPDPGALSVTAQDVVKAGRRGIITMDLNRSLPDQGVTALQDLALPTAKPELAFTPLNLAKPAAPVTKEAATAATATSESAALSEMVLAPMAGEVFKAGQNIMLTWFAPELDRVAEQEIRLSVDGGKTYDIVITPHVPAGVQFFNWVVPDGVDSQNVRVRVVLRDAYGIETITESSEFSIRPGADFGAVSLLNLNGNEGLVGGRSFMIRWKTNNGFQPLGYDLTLLIGTKRFYRISTGISGDTREFNWVVPANLFTKQARVQLTAYNIGGQPLPVISSADFSIVPQPAVSRVRLRKGRRGTALIVEGAGLIARDSVIEINGVVFEPKYGRASRSGLTNELVLERSDLLNFLPLDTITTIVVRHRSNGLRSNPYLYMRSGSPEAAAISAR